MLRKCGFAVLVTLLLLSPVLAAEIGPRALRGKTSPLCGNLRRVHESIAQSARIYVRANTIRMARNRSFGEIVGRNVPGAQDLAGGGYVTVDRSALSHPEVRLLAGYAGQLATMAQQLQSAGLGGAAGAEAWRALALNPGDTKAGAILGYPQYQGTHLHPVAYSLITRRLALTRFGWLPDQLARQERSGYAPEAGLWRPLAIVDARHTSWSQRHVLTFTYIQIQTTLSLSEILPWALEVDDLVGWMRARFLHVPGYREPAWPLVVKIYRSSAEARSGGDQPPSQTAHWQGAGVIDHTAVMRAGGSLRNTVQMLLGQGLLEHAFPRQRRGTLYSGWMSGAFGRWIYDADLTRPDDTEYWEGAQSGLGAVIRELRLGRDVFGRLRSMPHSEGRNSELSRVAPMLLDLCANDPLAWEGAARFLAKLHGYREKRNDFVELLGTTPLISAAVNDWALRRSGVQPPGGGIGGSGQVSRTLTVGVAFLRSLGIDIAALRTSLGVSRANQIARDALMAYMQAETTRGKPGAGVEYTWRELSPRDDWSFTLSGPADRVQSLIDAILWRAGLRPPQAPPPTPPPAVPLPGSTPPPYVPPVVTPPGPTPPAAPDLGNRIFDRSVSEWAKSLLRGHREVSPQVHAKLDRGDAAAVGTLLELQKRGRPGTRAAVVKILGRIGTADNRVVPALASALEDSDRNVRLAALDALGGLGDNARSAVPEMSKVMVGDRDPAVRRKAAETLEKMPAGDLRGALPTLLLGVRDKDDKTRRAAMKVLEKISGAYPETRMEIKMAILSSGGGAALLEELLKEIQRR